MNETQATLILALLFVLRCLLPPALTLAIGYVMNKQVTRWQEEEQAKLAMATAVPGGETSSSNQ